MTGLGGTVIDPTLQAMFRLQSADLQLAATVNAVTETLEIRGLALRLSGGTELTLRLTPAKSAARVAGASGASASPAMISRAAPIPSSLVSDRRNRPLPRGRAATSRVRFSLAPSANIVPGRASTTARRADLAASMASAPA